MCIDCIKDAFRQMMRFQQIAEFQQSRRIRYCFPIEINTNKATNCLTIVYCIFRALIRKSKALLHNIHPQHPSQSNRWMTLPTTHRIMRNNNIQQRCPRCCSLYLNQKTITPGLFLLCRIFQVRKTLLHRYVTRLSIGKYFI